MYETVEVSRQDAIAHVFLKRPERLNAINRTMVSELDGLCREFDADPSLRVVLFSGHGRAFCAGADITVLDEFDGAADPRAALDFIQQVQMMTNAIEALKVPTIAALNGIAYGGGCEIALACDLRLMASDTSIGVPEVKIGLLPGAGGSQRLARLLPMAIAKEMIYLGDPLSAEVALGHGLVNRVVAPERVLDEARAWAEKLANLAPLALSTGKRLIHGAALHGLMNGIEAERQAMGFLFATADKVEGVRAFLEKRKPTFTGH